MRIGASGIVLAGTLVLAACGSDDAPLPTDAGIPDAGADAAPRVAPDLRFKLVGEADHFVQDEQSNVLTGTGLTHNGGPYVWLPLEIYNRATTLEEWSWEVGDIGFDEPVEDMRSLLSAHILSELDTVVADVLAAESPVVTSFDIEGGAFAMVASVTASHSPRYESRTESTSRPGLPALARDEGAAGRVITALTARGDNLLVFSAARAGDTQTYETRVADATFATLPDVAGELSGQGYVISAFGKAATGSFVVVGTRAVGVSAPRALFAEIGRDQRQAALAQGFAVVAAVMDDDQGTLIVGQK